jgi:hypothetical protein
MTPKEKAIELYEKMLRVEYPLAAKHCALIAVDEVIEALHEHHWQNRLTIDYWEEVKHELEKL